MEFNKHKGKIMPMGRKNNDTGWGLTDWGSSLAKKDEYVLLVDSELNVRQQYTLAAKMANNILGL